MIPRIIHQIWVGPKPMPEVLRGYVASVRNHHPLWTHILWTDELLHHLGAPIENEAARLRSMCSKSGIIRLGALAKFGGIYLDADCECLRPLDELLGHAAFGALQDPTRICPAVIGAEQGNAWIRWQIAHWKDFDQQDPASGVYLASTAPRELVTLIPPHLVFPFGCYTPPAARHPAPDSMIVHHWMGMW